MTGVRRSVVVVIGCALMGIDLLAIGGLAAINQWRVLHDRPPALVPGYGARIAAYVLFVLVAGLALRYTRRHIVSRKMFRIIVLWFGLLLCRALVLGPLYPWGARDVAEFVAAKAAVDLAAREGERYFAEHGRTAESLKELNLPVHKAKDPWGFTLGYERMPSGFRVFVRGAPGYIANRDEMRRHLSKDVLLPRQRARV